MFGYSTPGVYFEWQDTAQHQIQPARVDIAGFVGIAERGPLHRPERIESWNQFTSLFGRHTTQGYLAYAIQGFFANGGRICWVVRVADPLRAKCASIDIIAKEFGSRMLRLTATSPGVWSHKLDVTTSLLGKRFSLILRLPDGTQEVWRDLSIEEYEQDQSGQQRKDARFVETLLRPAEPSGQGASDPRLIRHHGSLLVYPEVLERSAEGSQIELEARASTTSGHMQGGADGLRTLAAEHISGIGSPIDSPWGLATLEKVAEISIVAIADIMPAPFTRLQHSSQPKPSCSDLEPVAAPPYEEADPEHPWMDTAAPILELQRELVAHCERMKNRVALVDARLEDRSPQALLAWRRNFDSSYAALYHPWLLLSDPLGKAGKLKAVPPSGHVAGIYARVEAQTGAHKPPANEELEMVRDVSIAVDDVQHGYLNEHSVNVIRAIAGRGIRVSGARTLSSDSQWRYVNVRRLLLMLERAIDTQTQWLVFEANNPDLWGAVERVVRSFLDRIWQAGMLEGATAADAYQVTCDASTNPPAEIEAGRMITLIGVQPPWPSEFVLVRIGKTESGIEIL